MAEVDRLVAQASDASGGALQLVAVVEDTQTTLDPRGRVSPIVVSVKLSNTSNQRGQCIWQASSGEWNDNVVLTGENMESRISPPNQEYFHIWASRANLYWG
jgi:hypothetical protein